MPPSWSFATEVMVSPEPEPNSAGSLPQPLLLESNRHGKRAARRPYLPSQGFDSCDVSQEYHNSQKTGAISPIHVHVLPCHGPSPHHSWAGPAHLHPLPHPCNLWSLQLLVLQDGLNVLPWCSGTFLSNSSHIFQILLFLSTLHLHALHLSPVPKRITSSSNLFFQPTPIHPLMSSTKVTSVVRHTRLSTPPPHLHRAWHPVGAQGLFSLPGPLLLFSFAKSKGRPIRLVKRSFKNDS